MQQMLKNSIRRRNWYRPLTQLVLYLTPLYSRVINHLSNIKKKKSKGGTSCGTVYPERTQYYGYEIYWDRESQEKQYNTQKKKRIELDRQNEHSIINGENRRD